MKRLRLLLFVALLSLLGASTGLAAVQTDKSDYPPGETVYISGDGMLPGETVAVDVFYPNGSLAQHHEVTASASGSFSDTYLLPPPETPVFGMYTVVATGLTSGSTFTTTFGDGNVKAKAAPSGVTFTLIKSTYSPPTTNCTGTPASTSTITGVDSSGNTTGVGNTESVKLTAAATSDQGGAFINWTSIDPFTNLGSGSICVQGFTGGGSRDYFANYSTPPANTPPTVTADSTSVTVNEGTTAANTGTYSDPDTSNNVSITASVGSVIKTGTNSGTWSWSFATNDGPSQSQTVTITANDGNGGISTTTFSLTVNNVPPSVGTVACSPEPSDEGSAVTCSASFTDPGTSDAPFTCTVDYGSGAEAGTVSSGTCSGPSHTYADNGSFTVTVSVTDKDGGTGSNSTTHVVNNVAPSNLSLSLSASTINENDSVTLNGSFNDPGTLDSHTVVINWGDGSPTTTINLLANVLTFSTSHQYLDDNPTGTASDANTISVTVTDDDGDSTSGSTSITVNNVAPSVGAVSCLPEPSNEGSSVTCSASFTDPGSVDTHTCTVNFDDGSSVSGTVGSGSCSASHTYTDDSADACTGGVCNVTLSVSDDDGGQGSSSVVHTVNNVAPTVTLSGPSSADEGQTKSYSYTTSDPGTETFSHTASCGASGTLSNDTFNSATGAGSFNCTFPDGPASSTVSVTVDDGDGGSDSDSIVVSVANVAPTVSLSGPTSANEGDTKSYSFTTSDPGQDTFSLVSQTCGANGTLSNAAFNSATGAGSFDCTFPDGPASSTVSIQIADSDGANSNIDSKTVTIANVAPTPSISGAPASSPEGTTINLTGSATDPSSADTAAGFTFAWSVTKNGTPFGSGGAGASFITPDDNGTYVVTLDATDKDGGSGSTTATINVTNVPPSVGTVTCTPEPSDEGSSATCSASFTDPGTNDAPFTCTVDYGSGAEAGTVSSGTCTGPAHTYADNGSFTVTVSVTDKDGGTGSNSTTHVVNNVAPVISGVTGPTGPIALSGNAPSVTANFTDAGSADTHTCTFSWDDGKPTSNGTVTETGGNGSCKATYTYAVAGVYTVTVTVTDDDGGTTSAVFEYIVIYDPSAGFVTGGGWINSTSVDCPSFCGAGASGKANFGFVSKYKKGATAPTGETEFQFKAGNLNFHSTAYEWLVVAGAKAQYKGSGTINGSGDYGFLLTATDGQINGGGGVDKFRIKIWNKSTGATVYDNAPGSDDIDTSNQQAISGGSIVVHK